MPFVRICSVNDIKPGEAKEFEVQGKEIAVFNVDGEFYCIGARCNHAGGPLAEGTLDDYAIECPLHGARFDVRNGQDLNPPATGPMPTYKVRIEGSDVWVDV
ncbi:MAG TPA: non-heme iron oxygenase ferredoxin subunit [Candidatus Bilamarchaeaceae archaeon]|nr:non-heme iron oxygenase ferredoxin subunit [Candidatus Bilamarchaeaceae archaeon]